MARRRWCGPEIRGRCAPGEGAGGVREPERKWRLREGEEGGGGSTIQQQESPTAEAPGTAGGARASFGRRRSRGFKRRRGQAFRRLENPSRTMSDGGAKGWWRMRRRRLRKGGAPAAAAAVGGKPSGGGGFFFERGEECERELEWVWNIAGQQADSGWPASNQA